MKMDEVRERMRNFLINANASGTELAQFLARPSVSVAREPVAKFVTLLPPFRKSGQGWPRATLLAALPLLAVIAIGSYTRTRPSSVANEDSCIVQMPAQLQKAFRPPESCSFCRAVHSVPRLANVSPDEFAERYAYRGGPIIVTDATTNWTATERFDYAFFRQLYATYGTGPRSERCQFFPYQTGFRDIHEALGLPEARVRYEPGTEPWYFGWSNCDPAIVRVLREHYGRPYFLPPDSENNAIDWVFMGGPGLGAHMHVDNVRLPSWQSQLKGAKEWSLAPPPECLYQCNFLSVVVQTGETIVLDTNKWYHKTNVLPGPISITVGAEYD